MKPHASRVPVSVALALLLSIARIVAAEPPSRDKPSVARPVTPKRGEILKLQQNSITAMPFLPPRNDRRSEPETYVLDDKTRIMIGRLTSESTNSSGGQVQSFKLEPAKRDDLKIGQRVRIQADGGRAVMITVFPGPPELTRKKE